MKISENENKGFSVEVKIMSKEEADLIKHHVGTKENDKLKTELIIGDINGTYDKLVILLKVFYCLPLPIIAFYYLF
jgi:hypothetical protein